MAKLSRLLWCMSYSGSCGTKTPFTLSNVIIEVTKRSNFFNFFTNDINRVDVLDGQVWYFTSALLTFKIKVRFQRTLDVWTAFVHPKATNKAIDRLECNNFIAHITRKFTCPNWFRGIMCIYHDLCLTSNYTQT